MEDTVKTFLEIAKQRRIINREVGLPQIVGSFPRFVHTKHFGTLVFEIDDCYNLGVIIRNKFHTCYIDGLHEGDKLFNVGKNHYHRRPVNLNTPKYTARGTLRDAVADWTMARRKVFKIRGDDVFRVLFNHRHREIEYKGHWYYLYKSRNNKQRFMFSTNIKTGIVYLLKTANMKLPNTVLTEGFDMEILAKLERITLLSAGFLNEDEMWAYREARYSSFLENYISQPEMMSHKSTMLNSRFSTLKYNHNSSPNSPLNNLIGRWYHLRVMKGLEMPEEFVLSYAISMR